jgi:hypothetical protein
LAVLDTRVDKGGLGDNHRIQLLIR